MQHNTPNTPNTASIQIITIILETDVQGQNTLQYMASDGVTPAAGENACRLVAERFREASIEAEIQRRVDATIAESEAEEEA